MTMINNFFVGILAISRCTFFFIMVLRLPPFYFPVLLKLDYLNLCWLSYLLIYVTCNWAVYSIFPLLHYRHKIGQFISKALKNYGFVILLVYASYQLLFFVLFLVRVREGSCPYNNNDNKKDDQFSYINEWSGVVAMSALSTAILSAVKLVAPPMDASAVARFFMAHFVINTLLLFRDGASRVALAAAFFPLLPAIAADLCTLADAPALPCRDMQIKQVSDCEEVKIKQVSDCEEVKIKQVSNCEEV